MSSQQDFREQIIQAIHASENIIVSLYAGDIEAAERFDQERVNFIRSMSKRQNLDNLVPTFSVELERLSELDKSIVCLGEKLRDEILTDIQVEQVNRLVHVQYAQNQKLSIYT
jgi:hypothetical protein